MPRIDPSRLPKLDPNTIFPDALVCNEHELHLPRCLIPLVDQIYDTVKIPASGTMETIAFDSPSKFPDGTKKIYGIHTNNRNVRTLEVADRFDVVRILLAFEGDVPGSDVRALREALHFKFSLGDPDHPAFTKEFPASVMVPTLLLTDGLLPIAIDEPDGGPMKALARKSENWEGLVSDVFKSLQAFASSGSWMLYSVGLLHKSAVRLGYADIFGVDVRKEAVELSGPVSIKVALLGLRYVASPACLQEQPKSQVLEVEAGRVCPSCKRRESYESMEFLEDAKRCPECGKK